MKLKTMLFVILFGTNVWANNKVSIKCESLKKNGNSAQFKIKGDFEVGKKKMSLSDTIAEAKIQLRIKASIDNHALYSEKFELDGVYKNTASDDSAFAEVISGRNKKIQFEYLVLSDKEGSLIVKIQGVTRGPERLECVVD